MIADPLEQKDIADEHPEVVASMLRDYDAWFRDVESTRHFAPPRIHLGSPAEDPATLTRQDWRGEADRLGARGPGRLGRRGRPPRPVRPRRDVRRRPAGDRPRRAGRGVKAQTEIGQDARTCRIEGVRLPEGPGTLRAWVDRPERRRRGVSGRGPPALNRDGGARSARPTLHVATRIPRM